MIAYPKLLKDRIGRTLGYEEQLEYRVCSIICG